MSALFLIVLIDLIGFGVIIPLLPFYAERFQASPDVVTLVMAVYSMAQLFSAPLWGRLSDRIGRRPVLLVSMAGASISYIWLGLADELWTLFAARAFCGAMAGNLSAAFAYVADVTAPENRARGMGLIGAAYGLGFIAGPALGGILAGPDPVQADYQTPAFVAAGMSMAALLMTALFLKESLSAELRAEAALRKPDPFLRMMSDVLGDRRLAFWIGLSFLATLVLAGMETTFAMWSERTFGWGPQQNGYLLAFLGLLSAAIQSSLIGPLSRRYGTHRMVIQGAAVLALSFLFLPFANTLGVLLVVTAGLAYGFSILSPALNSLISLEAEAGSQGRILGLSRSASILARVVGPALAGMLFAGFGRDAPYFASAVLMLVVFLVAFRPPARKPRSEEP
ncbi:MAG: MFS transporter [Rhodospirillales bacterium]|jgi:DHA1 family tetracycline resistance protein-like MFS transporter|nr:MFS transporter [Rhodospirillales bacterium]